MKISKTSLVLTAAMTGLLGGTVARAAAPVQDTKQDSTAKKDTKSKASKAKVEKHACAGKNSCKGNGGCATDGKKK
jgi:hypothetical protein